jgi:hypothetical protein
MAAPHAVSSLIAHQFECSAITRRPLRRPIIGYYNTALDGMALLFAEG